MRCQNVGIILPSILIVISIISGLSILLFQLGLMNLKIANVLQQRSQFKAILENTIVNVETTQLYTPATCHYAESQGINYFVQQPERWWLLYACKDETANPSVYYFVEKLQQFPCVWIIRNNNKQIAQAIFYRITARVIAENVKGMNLIAQSVYVVPQMAESSCQSTMTVFHQRQSLRTITEAL